eukprot:341004-Amphidinium_carterae.1
MDGLPLMGRPALHVVLRTAYAIVGELWLGTLKACWSDEFNADTYLHALAHSLLAMLLLMPFVLVVLDYDRLRGSFLHLLVNIYDKVYNICLRIAPFCMRMLFVCALAATVASALDTSSLSNSECPRDSLEQVLNHSVHELRAQSPNCVDEKVWHLAQRGLDTKPFAQHGVPPFEDGISTASGAGAAGVLAALFPDKHESMVGTCAINGSSLKQYVVAPEDDSLHAVSSLVPMHEDLAYNDASSHFLVVPAKDHVASAEYAHYTDERLEDVAHDYTKDVCPFYQVVSTYLLTNISDDHAFAHEESLEVIAFDVDETCAPVHAEIPSTHACPHPFANLSYVCALALTNTPDRHAYMIAAWVPAKPQVTQAIRDQLGQHTDKLYRLLDIPVGLEAVDVREMLAQIGWPATLMDFSKTCRKGLACWNVRAQSPPDAMAYPMCTGHHRFSVRIVDPSLTKSSRQRAASVPATREFTGSVTWSDALVGKHAKPQTPQQQQSSRPLQRSASSHELGAEESEGRCEMYDLERPPKKPRNAGNRKSREGTDMDDDEEQLLSSDPEQDDQDDQEHSDGEKLDEVQSQPDSFGFGSDADTPPQGPPQQASEVEEGWHAPKRTFRATFAARPKSAPRVTPVVAASAVPPQVHAHENRISGLEAGVGRLESMLASMMSQTQQQQQQLLVQVQAMVQGASAERAQQIENMTNEWRGGAGKKGAQLKPGEWKVSAPPSHRLDDVDGDGRCLYRSLALIQGTTWQQEYEAVQTALRNPSQALLDAWFDLDTPMMEAERLLDGDASTPLPAHAWPGAQALLAWSIISTCSTTVLTTTGATLEYTYGHEGARPLYLAYNGQHYRPFMLKSEVDRSYASAKPRLPKPEATRNKKLNTGFRKMELMASVQNWQKVPDDGLHDDDAAVMHGNSELSVWFANINSLAANLDAVLDVAEAGADIIGLAEHCVADCDVEITTSKFKDHKWTTHWRTGRVDAAGRTTGGVGLLLRTGLQFVPSSHPVLKEFEQLGRVLTGWVLQDGKPCFHLMVVYAVADPHTPQNESFSRRMQQALGEWHCIHRGQKVCCMGDFNMTLDEDWALSSWVMGGQYIDTVETFRRSPQREATHVAGRCIDYMLASTTLSEAIVDSHVDPQWRFPSHRAVCCRISLSKLHERNSTTGVSLRIPQRMPTSAAIKARLADPEQPDTSFGKADFDLALQQQDVDAALRTWSIRWERRTLAAAEACGVPTMPHMEGRGLPCKPNPL